MNKKDQLVINGFVIPGDVVTRYDIDFEEGRIGIAHGCYIFMLIDDSFGVEEDEYTVVFLTKNGFISLWRRVSHIIVSMVSL